MKKGLKVLSTAGLAAVFAASVGVPTQAAVIDRVLEDTAGTVYQYDEVALGKSYTAFIVNEDSKGAALYKHYLNNIKNNPNAFVAFNDDKAGYVTYESVQKAFNKSIVAGEDFNLDNYTESGEGVTAEVKNYVNVTVGEDGAIVETPVTPPVEEVTVQSVSAINDITLAFGEESAETVVAGLQTTVTATLNDEETTEVTLDVEWVADANYDENVAGVYTFTGTVTLPADVDYTISEELSTVTVKVTVEAATEEQIATAILAVNEATDDAEVLVALQSPVLGLENVDENVDYYNEIDNSFTTTKAQIQAAVNRANAAAGEANEDFIKAVNEATGETALLDALSDLGINNVITSPSQGIAYYTAIAANTTETKAQIQAVIDQVNLTELTKLVVAAEKSVKASDVVTAKTLLDAYLPVDTGDVTTVADFQKRLDVVTALVAVNNAVDADALLIALNKPVLALENVVTANEDDYLEKFEDRVTADANFEFATVSALQTFVNKVNTDKAAGKINTVNTTGAATDAGAFATAITATGVTTVDSDNNDAYLAAFKAKVAADSKFKFTTVEEIKAFVKAVNTAETEKTLVTAVNEASASDIVTALTDFVGEYNNDAYLNLGSSANGKRNEVSRLFRGIKADTTYKTKEEVQTALTSATEVYNTALNNVLNSKSISETRTNLQAVYDLALTYFTVGEVNEIDGPTVTIKQAEKLFEALETERAKDNPVLPKNFDEVLTAATPVSIYTDLAQFDAAAESASAGSELTLDVSALNGETIDIENTNSITINLIGDLDSGTLTVDAPSATVNNNAINGTFIITDISSATWNENANNNNFVFNDPDTGTNFNIKAGNSVGSLELNGPATVNVPTGSSVGTLTNNVEGTTVTGEGTVVNLDGDALPTFDGTVQVDNNELSATVSTEGEFETALADDKIKEINISASFEVKKPLQITRQVTVNGGENFTITRASDFQHITTPENVKVNSVVIVLDSGSGTVINDLTVDARGEAEWDSLYALQVYNATDVTLNDVTVKNADGGLLVNGSTVTATNITTIGNEFGGIEVSKGTADGLSNSILTVTGNSVHTDASEMPAIWVYTAQGTLTSELYEAVTGGTNEQQYYNLKQQ